MCLGLQPFALIDVDFPISSSRDEFSYAQIESGKATRFIKRGLFNGFNTSINISMTFGGMQCQAQVET